MKKEKLVLKKETIQNLNKKEMDGIQGGATLSIWGCATNDKTRTDKCCPPPRPKDPCDESTCDELVCKI